MTCSDRHEKNIENLERVDDCIIVAGEPWRNANAFDKREERRVVKRITLGSVTYILFIYSPCHFHAMDSNFRDESVASGLSAIFTALVA